jgi:hypothetical protein
MRGGRILSDVTKVGAGRSEKRLFVDLVGGGVSRKLAVTCAIIT